MRNLIAPTMVTGLSGLLLAGCCEPEIGTGGVPRSASPTVVRALSSCPINQEDAANSPMATIGQAVLSIALPAVVGMVADEAAEAIEQRQRQRLSSSTATTSLNLWKARLDDESQLTVSFKCIVIVRGKFSRTIDDASDETPTPGWTRAKNAKEDVWTQDQTTDLNSRLKLFYEANPQTLPLYLAGTPEMYVEVPIVTVPLTLPKDHPVTNAKGEAQAPLVSAMSVPMTLSLGPPTVHYYASGAKRNGSAKAISLRARIDATTIENQKATITTLLDRPFGLGLLPIGTVRHPERFADFPMVRIPLPAASNASIAVMRGNEQLFASVINPVPLDITVEITESEDASDIERNVAAWLRRKETKDELTSVVGQAVSPPPQQ